MGNHKHVYWYICHTGIYNYYIQVGYDQNSMMKVEEVSKYDQWHYEGTTSIDEAIKQLGIEYDGVILLHLK